MAELIYFVFVSVTTQNVTVIVLHFANFFLSIWKAIFKQFNFTVNHKPSGKMESVTMDVVAEENQEECLEIQDQASGEVHVSMKASHCHLLAKRRAAYRRQSEACTQRDESSNGGGGVFCM